VMVLSGDSHVSMAADLHQAPTGSSYDGGTGSGSVAVEFLPTSITRGNFDEMGYPSWVVSAIEGYMASANPNQVFSNIVDHGYGILDIKTDSAIAEFWYMDILSQTTSQTFETGLLLKDAENHWHRTNLTSPTPDKDYSQTITNSSTIYKPLKTTSSELLLKVFPNPSYGEYTLNFEIENDDVISIEVLELSTGKVLHTVSNKMCLAKQTQQVVFNISQLSAGTYFLRLKGKDIETGKVIVQQ